LHDPYTRVLEIKYPWWKHRPGKEKMFPKGYRETMAIIWHKDPEKDGFDDSCDWFGTQQLKHDSKDYKKIMYEADFEYETEQCFLDREGRPQTSCFEMLFGVSSTILWRVWRKEMTPRLMMHLARLASNPVDNFQEMHRKGVTSKK